MGNYTTDSPDSRITAVFRYVACESDPGSRDFRVLGEALKMPTTDFRQLPYDYGRDSSSHAVEPAIIDTRGNSRGR